MAGEGVVRAGGRLSPLMATLRARRAERALRGIRRGRLLDIGCGHYPFFLTRTDFAGRYGIDREPGPDWHQSMRIGLHLGIADVGSHRPLPFRDGSFDAVTMLAVVEHLDEATLSPLLDEIRRVLTDRGRLVITTPPPWSDPVLRALARLGLSSSTELDEHQAAYTPARLRALLEHAGFSRARSGLFELGLNVWASGDRSDAPGEKKRSLMGLLPTLLVIAGIAGLVVRERDSFARALELIGRAPSLLWLAALAMVVAGRGVLACCSFVIATRRMAGAGAGAAAFAWLRSAVTKYVPGVIWYPLSAVDRLRRFGVGASGAALGFYVDAVASIAAAVLIGASAVPALVADGTAAALWLLLAVPALLSLHPRVFAIGVRAVGRLTSRSVPDVALTWPTVGTTVGLHIGSWLAAGVSLQLVIHALGTNISWPMAFAATALSWAVGLLAVPIPAGLGVREAVLVTLLVTEIPTATALAAALMSRALFVALDVTALAASFPVALRLRRRGTTSKGPRPALGSG